MSSSLVPALYRNVLKKVAVIDKHYKGNTDHVLKSIWGIKVNALLFDRSGFGNTASVIAQRVFKALSKQHSKPGCNKEQEGIQKVFWFLRCTATSLPDEAVDAQYMDRYSTVEFASDKDYPDKAVSFLRSFKVRSVMPLNGSRFALARHCIPREPFWMLQLQSTFKFPFVNELLLIEAAAAAAATKDGKATADDDKKLCDGSTLHLPSTDNAIVQDMFSKCYSIQSSVTTNNVQVVCRTEYLGERMVDANNEVDDGMEEDDEVEGGTPLTRPTIEKQHIFQYYITIRHLTGDSPTRKGNDVLLLSRHWVFYDLDEGTVHEVTGSGVVGEYPCLAPGDSHTYVSGTAMKGKRGIMRGTFQMVVIPENSSKPTFSSLLSAAGDSKTEDGKSSTAGGGVEPHFFDVEVGSTRLSAEHDLEIVEQ